ncbi:hypothetical protein FT663_00947 [Candidozyma haemuli var. vulneris]|uniref:Cytochrome c oxidase assembly protein COX15 n=1 Tax=Candidozyma haemuli TaxID=45357 RepID=A0A2V1AQF0_9ASCO|nr:hypothetical protein CXQ85_001857 [[Candida] haemuloni]KAF3993123.1 hypothetical protein FT662_00751 [[Candida] haemuloni var. vulneris]KAF3994973.1 hypothetical protein FT663_00947 [[Candida] haemuloni var. vulneris]PVH20078.1 hypothetical protein CXQ85_001857 [[Candida] haemuloni]
MAMFCRSGFFFTKNASVLNILKSTRGSRLSIVPPKRRSFNIWRSLGFRGYSTASSDLAANSVPKINTEPLKSAFSSKKQPPVVSSKVTGYWLIATSGLIFGIVVVGGLTRLTESGLSITEWKPVTGSIPPIGEKAWEEEFDKYKNSPEFKLLNSHITMEEFKFIFSMEWGHRLLGRAIGMFFVLPAVYFWKTKKFSPHVTRRVVGLTGLLGLQGFIGWWMVQSGLDEEQLAERRSKPTVSQYRLTTHLGAAFLMYLGVLWTGFEILNESKWVQNLSTKAQTVTTHLAKLNNPALNPMRKMSLALLGLTFVTAMSGGMVAGLDAGLIYNTFPHMGEDYLPSYRELMDSVYARKEDHSDLWWRNLLENPTTVQLIHRILATTTFFSVLGAHMYVNKRKALMPANAKKAMHTMMGLVTFQVALGISTLIYLVPIPLAAGHQAGALALLTAALAFAANLKRPRPQTVNYISSKMKEQLLKKK